MKPEEFCRWLQGFAELHDGQPNAKQWELIKKHLQTVYVKVTDKPSKEMEEFVRSIRTGGGEPRIC